MSKWTRQEWSPMRKSLPNSKLLLLKVHQEVKVLPPLKEHLPESLELLLAKDLQLVALMIFLKKKRNKKLLWTSLKRLSINYNHQTHRLTQAILTLTSTCVISNLLSVLMFVILSSSPSWQSHQSLPQRKYREITILPEEYLLTLKSSPNALFIFHLCLSSTFSSCLVG